MIGRRTQKARDGFCGIAQAEHEGQFLAGKRSERGVGAELETERRKDDDARSVGGVGAASGKEMAETALFARPRAAVCSLTGSRRTSSQGKVTLLFRRRHKETNSAAS